MNTQSITAAIVTFVFTAIGLASQSTLQPSPELGYSTSPTVSLHEPVLVTIRVTNPSLAPLFVNWGDVYSENGNFEITVTAPDGSIKRLPPAMSVLRIAPERVAPQRTFEDSYVLDRWFDFSRVGQYQIKIKFTGAVSTSNAAVDVRRDGNLDVRVGEQDADRLRSICREWRDIVLHTSLARPRSRAAQALAYVRDPVAAPFLREIIEGDTGFSGDAWEGLVRIGGQPARNELEILLGNPNTAAKARVTLARIGG